MYFEGYSQLNVCNGHILSLYLLMNSKGISYSFTFKVYISKHEINPGLEIIVKLNSMYICLRDSLCMFCRILKVRIINIYYHF
jgi:hypothetical protein